MYFASARRTPLLAATPFLVWRAHIAKDRPAFLGLIGVALIYADD